jgi:AAA domain
VSPVADGYKPLKAFTGDLAPEVVEIEWLVRNFLARGAGTVMTAQPGVGKTVYAAALCACLWKGITFAGLETTGKRIKVLYVDVEKGWRWTAPYFRAAFRGLGVEGLPAEFHYWSPKTQECLYEDESGFVTLASIGPLIAEYCKAHGIDFVVIDSFGQSFAGDQNSNQDVSLEFRLGLNPITLTGASVLLIAHATKASMNGGPVTPSGAQQIRAWPVVSVSLEQEGDKQDGRVRWSVDKTNGAPFKAFITRLDFQTDFEGRLEKVTLEYEGEAGEKSQEVKSGGELSARRTILATLKSGEKKRGDFPKSGTFDRTLKDLLESGEIVRVSDRGPYSLPESEMEPEAELPPEDQALEFAPTLAPPKNPPLENAVQHTNPLHHTTRPLGDGAMVQDPDENLHQSLHQVAPTHTKDEEVRAVQPPVLAPTHTKLGKVRV